MACDTERGMSELKLLLAFELLLLLLLPLPFMTVTLLVPMLEAMLLL